MKVFAAAILLLFLAWYFLVPEPQRTIPETTEIFRARIRAAQRIHGVWPMEAIGDQIVFVTPRGKIRI